MQPVVAPERVSLVVVVRNGERFLGEALRSALAQTLPPAEILVIDGQSTDGTARVARSFPEVRHLIQRDRGLAQARNLGIEAARHELIAFLDHDDLWEPRKLEAQVRVMSQQESLAYTLTRMRFFLEQGAPRPGHIADDLLERPRSAATPSALVARRPIFDHLGGFDPSLAIGCDTDWFTRARDAGVPWTMLPQVLLKKRLHEHNLSSNVQRNRREMFEVARRSIARQNPRRTHR